MSPKPLVEQAEMQKYSASQRELLARLWILMNSVSSLVPLIATVKASFQEVPKLNEEKDQQEQLLMLVLTQLALTGLPRVEVLLAATLHLEPNKISLLSNYIDLVSDFRNLDSWSDSSTSTSESPTAASSSEDGPQDDASVASRWA